MTARIFSCPAGVSDLDEIATRPAVSADISAIKLIADAERRTLGFVRRAIFEASAADGELLVAADADGRIVGFLRWHRRRDGWSTIYEIGVDRSCRKRGIGRRLVGAIPGPIRLKCPVDGEANGFYRRLGFVLLEVAPGRCRPLNLWVAVP